MGMTTALQDDEDTEEIASVATNTAAADARKAVALYTLWFYTRNAKQRQKIIIDWI